MSTGTLKDLTKAIYKSAPELSLPLPTSLLEVISAYLEKHSSNEEFESRNLQDELLAIYQNTIAEYPSRFAAFLVILQELKVASQSSGRLLQWWGQLLNPILIRLGVEPRLSIETRDTLIRILVYDEDIDQEKMLENAKATSDAITEIMLATWLTKRKQADEEFNSNAEFVANYIESILIEYGKKRPKNFLTVLNKFFVRTESRISSLSLLCSFFRHPPPHLHQMLLTPLFKNLLRCLEFDTSTRTVSLAMTALVMFLPHIPSITSQYLPALFNIYTRLLFWDRVRQNEAISSFEMKDATNEVSEVDWTKISYLNNSGDGSVPEVLHYFTFLYGLYPINFMSYIRKPHKYLARFNYVGVELDIQPVEVRQRSEPFRRAHLLHPNFFNFTIETELTDNTRWLKSDTADVVAECMALSVPCEDLHEQASKSSAKSIRTDLLAISLLSKESASHLSDFHGRRTSSQPESIFDSRNESSHFTKVSDSACSPQNPMMTDSKSQINNSDLFHHPAEILGRTNPSKKNVLKIMKNDSVSSLALSNHHDSHINSYLKSLSQESFSRPSSAHQKDNKPLTVDMRLTYLYREIQLLRNDLNFERYLKQQHLSHIGQLRRKQIREARTEAETQDVVASNRTLNVKLEEAKRLNMQFKKEYEKSKTHCRKWESELSVKLRALREEQKKWALERQSMAQELELAKENEEVMREIILQLEASELKSKQKATHAESCHEELLSLRKELEDLNFRVKISEINEGFAIAAKKNEMTAEARAIMLEAELEARDRELLNAKEVFQKEIQKIRIQSQEASVTPKLCCHNLQKMIDIAVATSHNRIIELEKSYKNLLVRYSALQDEYYGFQNTKNESVPIDKCTDSDSSVHFYPDPGKERAVKHPSSESEKDGNNTIESF